LPPRSGRGHLRLPAAACARVTVSQWPWHPPRADQDLASFDWGCSWQLAGSTTQAVGLAGIGRHQEWERDKNRSALQAAAAGRHDDIGPRISLGLVMRCGLEDYLPVLPFHGPHLEERMIHQYQHPPIRYYTPKKTNMLLREF